MAQCATAVPDSSPVYPMRDPRVAPARAQPSRAGPVFEHAPPPGETYVVEVELVIDTLGRPDLCHARVLRANPASSAERALRVLSTWTFTPATVEGARVRQMTRLVFEAGRTDFVR